MNLSFATRRVGCGIVAIALASAGVALAQQSAGTSQTNIIERPSATDQGAGASRLQHNSANRSGMEQGTEQNEATESSSPKTFLKEAAEGNDAEIAMAEVALRKAQNPQVKQLAQTIKQDHTQANQLLRPIAQKHSVDVQRSLKSKFQSTLDQLQQASGGPFDKMYVTHMLKDHAKDIPKFQRQAEQAQNSDVRQYAEEVLPKLRHHLALAEQAAQAIGMNQARISSIVKQEPGSVGGVGENVGTQSGSVTNNSGLETTNKAGSSGLTH